MYHTIRSVGFFLALSILLSCCQYEDPLPATTDPGDVITVLECDPDNGGLTLPEGFCALTVIDSLGYARHMAVRENGDLYVSMRQRGDDSGGIAALRDTTRDGRVDVVERFVEQPGTGIGLHDGYLYFGSQTSVVRYPLSPEALMPTAEAQPVITGFPDQNSHAAKPIVFDGQGHLYVNVGAPSNACQEQDRTPSPGLDPCPELEQQGGLWRYDANQLNQVHPEDGYRYATGIRNVVGFAWNPSNNALYATQHGRDQLFSLWPDFYTREESAELPAEEFFRVDDGTNLGWPFCYYDQFKEVRVRAPEYGGDGESTEGCEDYDLPLVAFPGHYAPNDLLFLEGDQFPERYRQGAFIAFHGSWNRSDDEGQKGYLVAFVPAQGDAYSSDWEVFADGFKGAATIETPDQAEYRPTGLAEGPDGTLFISDSRKGKIWRVMYTGDM